LKGNEEGFAKKNRNIRSHALRRGACIERTFVDAGHFAVREQGGSGRVADVKSFKRCLAAMSAGQKQGRGGEDTQGDCCEHDDGFPSHELTIKAEEIDVNVKF